jgi:RND family efflux transporter MFP subunit
MSNISQKQIVWSLLIISIIGIGYFYFGRTNDTTLQNTVTVKRGDVVQEVSVTGRVEPVSTVNLSFEKSGRIQGVYTRVGQHVSAGTLLAEIESSAAQASVMEVEARLAELKRGSRPEEITVKEAELAKYEQDLANSYGGVKDTIDDAFNKMDDALHVKMTGVFSGSKTSSYRFTYQICDSSLDTNGVALRLASEYDIDLWRTELATLSMTPSNEALSTALETTSAHLEKGKSFLEAVSRTLTLDCTIANAGLDPYRTNVNTARTNIATAIAAVNTKRQAIASLVLTVAKVKNELSLLKAGTASEVIAAQEARLLSAQGELRKHRIYAPISGAVTNVDAKTGEYANTTTPLLSIISDASFEMTANVPEADIAKIKLGNTAKVTLDAYGSDALFEGRVSAINPAETIIDNVPTYKVTLNFTKNDPRIKSGMTANIDIATAKSSDVLVIPQRAIATKDNQKFVETVSPDGSTASVLVTTGLRGSDGLIEITSGVSEGAIILFVPKQ